MCTTNAQKRYLVTDADPEKSYEYHGSDSYYEKEKQLLSCLLDDKTVSQQKLSVISASEPSGDSSCSLPLPLLLHVRP